MAGEITSFIHNIFIAIIALFPVINPIGTSLVLNQFFDGLTRDERKKMVFKIALYTFYICLFTLITGQWILQLFGISIPIVRFAGGIMICKIGWEFLSAKNADEQSTEKNQEMDSNRAKSLANKLFYPITFPMTIGGGTISVIFTLSATSDKHDLVSTIFHTSSILIGILVMCAFVYFMYLNSDKFIKRLGSKNQVLVNNIMAFLIFCVGLQIASSGIISLIKDNFI